MNKIFKTVAAVAVTLGLTSAPVLASSFGDGATSFGGVTIDVGTSGMAYGQRNEHVPGQIDTRTMGMSNAIIGGQTGGGLCTTPSCLDTDGALQASFGQDSLMEGYSMSDHEQRAAFLVGNTQAGGVIDASFGNDLHTGISIEALTNGNAAAAGQGAEVFNHAKTNGASHAYGDLHADSLCPSCVQGSRSGGGSANHHSWANSRAMDGHIGKAGSDAITRARAEMNLGNSDGYDQPSM